MYSTERWYAGNKITTRGSVVSHSVPEIMFLRDLEKKITLTFKDLLLWMHRNNRQGSLKGKIDLD